ncbi:hypothetical protein AeMF1_016856 [Aphanomyces euteiches]|nr:hypothetical protein AeMF1_016856 [Aphanomyces euteiches]
MFSVRHLLVVAALLQTNSAQKINGWYPCNLRTFSTAAPSSSSSSSASAEAEITARGWSATEVEDPAASIFRSLVVNPSTAIATTSTSASAECAEISMPLCHGGICTSNQTIQVFVKRMRARTQATKSRAIWVLQGGPGASSVNMETIMTALYNAKGSYFSGAVDVYTMDHRGTGRSSKLQCVATQIETSGSPTQGQITDSTFPTCVQDVNLQLGDDGDVNNLKSFSTTSAATDLSKLVTLLNPSSETYIYGVSYGTYLVERLMQLNNPAIKGYILDGVVSQSGSATGQKLSFADWATNMDEVGQSFLNQCAKDTTCSSYFPTTSAADTLKALYTAMDKNPTGTQCSSVMYSLGQSKTRPSYILRSLMGQLFQIQSVRSFIPALIYRFNRCNSNDVIAITNFFISFSAITSTPDESDSYDSTMLYNLIALSELFTYPTPTRQAVQAKFLNASIGSDTSDLVTLYCLASGGTDKACASEPMSPNKYKFIYPTDKYFDKPITIPTGASVLLMSGLLDPQTPPKFARYQYASFVGDDSSKRLIEFPASAHGTIINTPVTIADTVPCGTTIVSSYVMNSGDVTAIDTTCTGYLSPLSYAISPTLGKRLMATDDAYQGKPSGLFTTDKSSSSSSGSGSNANGGSSDSSAISSSSDTGVSSSWRGAAIAGFVVAGVLLLLVIYLGVRLRQAILRAKHANEYVMEPPSTTV